MIVLRWAGGTSPLLYFSGKVLDQHKLSLDFDILLASVWARLTAGLVLCNG